MPLRGLQTAVERSAGGPAASEPFRNLACFRLSRVATRQPAARIPATRCSPKRARRTCSGMDGLDRPHRGFSILRISANFRMHDLPMSFMRRGSEGTEPKPTLAVTTEGPDPIVSGQSGPTHQSARRTRRQARLSISKGRLRSATRTRVRGRN